MSLAATILKLRQHAQLNTIEFGKALGVSHVTVVHWEDGDGVGPFNRMRLLNYARQVSAPADVIAALEAVQPELSRTP